MIIVTQSKQFKLEQTRVKFMKKNLLTNLNLV